MQSTVLTTTLAAQSAPRKRVAIAFLIAAALAATITLARWLTRGAPTLGSGAALSSQVTVAIIVLLCAAGLAAIEYRRRRLAALCVAPVVLVIAVVIVSWVFGWSPPFGLLLFGEPGIAPSWFPPLAAIEAAIPSALVSLAIFALTIERLRAMVAPYIWATGWLLVVAAPLHFGIRAFLGGAQNVPTVGGVELIAAFFNSLAFTFLGLAMLASTRTRAAEFATHRVGDDANVRGARWRALFVVIAIATTVALWYAVRATEIRQLRGDVDFALDVTARAIRDGLADNVASADRLWQHWDALDWNVPDALFLSDASIYMRRRPAVAAVAMLDVHGAVLKAARRRPAFGSAQVEQDPVDRADRDTMPPPLLDDAARNALWRQVVASGMRLRGTPFVANGAEYTPVMAAIRDANGKLLGGFWLMHRIDISMSRILDGVAPDYHVRVAVGDRTIYDHPPEGGISAREQRFKRVDERTFFGTKHTIEIAPSEKVIARALGWTPLLVLIFAWASLFLLMFALYNERRVNALYRERERILDQSLDLICTLRGDGVIVTANAAAQRVLGVRSASLPNRSLFDFVLAEHRERAQRDWLRHAGETQTMPTPFVRADGRRIFLQAVSRWSPEERLLYCAIRDVSAEHQSNMQREHAEHTFHIGVEQAGCAVYEYQRNEAGGAAIHWVGAIRSLTGYDPEELAAAGFDGWMNLVHPDDAPHVRQILERCLETRQPHTVDYRLRRKDGSYVPVLDRGRHLVEKDDSLRGEDAPRMIGALIDLTAIRQQETALRRSEERYRIIASQVGAVIIERETATGRVRAFGPVEQIFGYTKEQLESRPMSRDDTMIHPDDRAHYFAAVDAAERALSSYYVEHRRRHRGGHYIYIAARGVVLAGADGRAEREIIAVTDITDRKRAELALQESEERFRLAVEQSRQIVYEYALDAELRANSRRFAGAIEAMLGYTPQEMNELYLDSNFPLVHPDDLAIVRGLGRAALTGDGTFQVEHRIRHKDGHYLYVESRGAVRRDERGQAVGILGLLLDISAAKSAEAERQRYTEQLRALADIAHQVSAFLSLHELLKYLSTSMRRLLGANAAAATVSDPSLSSTQVVAVSYADHYGPQRVAPAPLAPSDLQAEVTATNAPRLYTARQMASDRKFANATQRDELRHPLRGWLGAPLTARDGLNLGILELSDKIEGEFSEGDLQVLNQLAGLASVAIENIRLYATLEERVAARTRELEISNRELEAFSYSVSHDLRAPLRAIAGFSSILETEYGPKLDAGARRYIQRITAGVERMANLIDDLLSLARVSRTELARETVDLTALSKSVLKRHLERHNGRAVETVVDAKMKAVADPRLLEVALENLIENALKFSGTRDKSHVHVGHRRIDGRIVFYVADNGVGFDPKYASNLFGVFQRLHSASDFPGTGVGLATVQRIVQRHHGRIWAEAEVDRGATFYFTLSNEN